MNREQRRAEHRARRVPCDLSRKSTHRMRSNDGMKAKKMEVQPDAVRQAIEAKLAQ